MITALDLDTMSEEERAAAASMVYAIAEHIHARMESKHSVSPVKKGADGWIEQRGEPNFGPFTERMHELVHEIALDTLSDAYAGR
ncbi:MAG TPA: hypothetical protein DCY13_20570 [Verrucomicrobiales bacterium]|nr:hypothetical protein [Verrucomicrobiales bacterium]